MAAAACDRGATMPKKTTRNGHSIIYNALDFAMAWLKSDNILKQLTVGLAIALVFYVAAFSLIQYLRSSKGPWEVSFESDATGQPSMVIRQQTLHILQKLEFPGEHLSRTNFQSTIEFREAVTNLPFGQMLQQDPLYLPGSAAMDLFGHVVQLLPRTLIIDDKEEPWQANGVVVLRGTNRPPRK
jgi:hypothetical protein